LNLTQLLKAGTEGSVDTMVFGGEPSIAFHDESRRRLRYASVRIEVRIETVRSDSIFIRARVEIRDDGPPQRDVYTHRGAGGRGVTLPSEILPDGFWSELERKLRRGVSQARRGRELTPLLSKE
jgi:hypothetical protein